MSITEMNLMISTSLFHINHCLWEMTWFKGQMALLSMGAAAWLGPLDVLLELLPRILFIIQIGWENIFLLPTELGCFLRNSCFKLHSSVCSPQIWQLMDNSGLVQSHFPTKNHGPAGMALYLHSALHLSIYQGEAAGCQLLALCQYLITVQLCREQETFHIPRTWLKKWKAFITFMEASLRFLRKAIKLRGYTTVLT